MSRDFNGRVLGALKVNLRDDLSLENLRIDGLLFQSLEGGW